MDCSLPGSSVPGNFQARVLEWGAIAFSVATPECILRHEDLFKMILFFKFFSYSGRGGSLLLHTSFLWLWRVGATF